MNFYTMTKPQLLKWLEEYGAPFFKPKVAEITAEGLAGYCGRIVDYDAKHGEGYYAKWLVGEAV